MGRSRQSECDLSRDEVAAFKHCALLLLRSVAGARRESSMRSALSEWKAAAWALTFASQRPSSPQWQIESKSDLMSSVTKKL